MKNRFVLALALLLLCGAGQTSARGKRQTVYAVGFYNLENLFDTCHDEGKKDHEYLPEAKKEWNTVKYTHKLRNMARVLSEMGTDVVPPTVGCAVIGVSEVENSKALDDLTAQPALAARGYRYCHVEGPDSRGIDCALLYNPELFSVRDVRLVPYVQELAKDSAFFTRGFLTVSGTLAGEHLTVVVCHLPSRFSGSFYRESGGRQLRALKDSLLRDDPKVKVLVMGDMNDDPTDPSMAVELRARQDIDSVSAGDMYNPWWHVLVKDGPGTLMYKGAWNLFDQIILSPSLLGSGNRKDRKELKYHSHGIFRRDYMIQQDGKYKGSPLRTFGSGQWLDGYSDHLPTVVYLVKNSK